MIKLSEEVEMIAVLLIAGFIASVVTIALFPFLLFAVIWLAVFFLIASLLYYLIEKVKNGGKKWDWK